LHNVSPISDERMEIPLKGVSDICTLKSGQHKKRTNATFSQKTIARTHNCHIK